MFYKLTTLENLRHDNLYSGPHTMVPSSSCLVISLSVLVNALSHFYFADYHQKSTDQALLPAAIPALGGLEIDLLWEQV